MFNSPLKDGLIVLVILLLFFGPKRLPALSRAIGESVREFKGGIGHDSDAESAEIPAAAPTPPAAPAPVPAAAAPAPSAPAPAATAPSSTEQQPGA